MQSLFHRILKRPFEKSGHSFKENLKSQPLRQHQVFNRSDILTQGWYPTVTSKSLKEGPQSFKILNQRFVFFKTEKGNIYALDAFCPHMGADLGNGLIKGENLVCYFHRWEFSGKGKLSKIPDHSKPPCNVNLNSYPTKDIFGYIWIFLGLKETHPFPRPVGEEEFQFSSLFLKEAELFAHHHIMMANGIDLQHFSTVHHLDIKFKFEVKNKFFATFDWELQGEIPNDRFIEKLGRKLFGKKFSYQVRFSGGSNCLITYGKDLKLFNRFSVPSLYVMWGCLPQEKGVSKVKIFVLTKKRKGIIGAIKNMFLYALTLLLLKTLTDDDVKAFPNMRFNNNYLLKSDESVARFIQVTNSLEIFPHNHGSEYEH